MNPVRRIFFDLTVVVLLPGTGVIYTIAVGLGRGFRASVAAALGCTFGIVPASQNGSIAYLAYLAFMFMLMTFLVFVLYGAFASAARLYVIESPRTMIWFKRCFAGTFGILGLRLALADR